MDKTTMIEMVSLYERTDIIMSANMNGVTSMSIYVSVVAAYLVAGAYVAAKHGVAGLTKQFAVTYGSRGVRVNAIAPGYIETAMTVEAREQPGGTEFLKSLHPMGRLGQPEEIAAAASFLASDDASFITGVILPVDGGYTAR